MKNKNFNSGRQNFISNGKNKRIKNEKLRNILSWLLIGILCFTIIGSVLGTIAFGKTHTASADQVVSRYEYLGNNFIVPTTTSYPKITDYTYTIGALSVDVTLINGFTYLNNYERNENKVYCTIPNIRCVYYNRLKPLDMEFVSDAFYSSIDTKTTPALTDGYVSYFNGLCDEILYTDVDGIVKEAYDMETVMNNYSTAKVTFESYLYYSDAEDTGYNGYYGYVTAEFPLKFNNDIYSIRYYSTKSESVNFERIINHVEYTDANGVTAKISFRSTVSKSTYRTGYVSWEDRTYYLANAFNNDTLYQEGLEEGYNKGKYDGVVQYKDSSQFSEDAHDKFYNKFIEEYKESSSFKTLIEQAKESGRMEERAEGSNVTFTNTLSAMYNAPLGAFKQFLSFELLGVDMFGFFTGLFTIAFVLFVIKKLT